jgi:hypothetical protein
LVRESRWFCPHEASFATAQASTKPTGWDVLTVIEEMRHDLTEHIIEKSNRRDGQ